MARLPHFCQKAVGTLHRNALNALNRQALHATTLGFDHPRTGKPLRFESPAPADFTAALEGLRLNDTNT
jgi:23S rRNA-/tRNA-specific pseudouridylate synthase